MSKAIRDVPLGDPDMFSPCAFDLTCLPSSYKAAGANNTDEYGHLDTVEFLKCVLCVTSFFLQPCFVGYG